ncbi:MAG: hypothetical protein NVS3B10_13240 [Polyangiales bacterium]
MRYDEAVSELEAGDVIGRRYRLTEPLGAGAMGVVWSARNEAVDRSFAIKLMRGDAAKHPRRLRRFFREAKAAGSLRHRCIVEVYDLGRIDEGEHAGTPYLVMQLLDGEPLDSLLARLHRLPSGTALALIADVARGLHVAHAQRIVHRDLKPGNLFLHRSVEEDGAIVPKLLDFGVSKLLDRVDATETTVGRLLGSPAYMSPEQTWGEADLDARADVWSLGVVLHRCLCGALPFEGGSVHAVMMAINGAPARPLRERAPELPEDVCALVDRCLERDRGRRMPSALALAEAIDAALAAQPLPTLDLARTLRRATARSRAAPTGTGLEETALATSARAPTHATAGAASHPTTEATAPSAPGARSTDAGSPSTASGSRSPRTARLGALLAILAAAVAIALVASRRTRSSDPASDPASTLAGPSSNAASSNAATASASTPASAMALPRPGADSVSVAPRPSPAKVASPRPPAKVVVKAGPTVVTKKGAAGPAAHEGVQHADF